LEAIKFTVAKGVDHTPFIRYTTNSKEPQSE
jgi:hypothetical protein